LRWVLRFPLVQFLGINLAWGPKGIWWAMFISNFLAALISAFWFKLGSWKEKIVK